MIHKLFSVEDGSYDIEAIFKEFINNKALYNGVAILYYEQINFSSVLTYFMINKDVLYSAKNIDDFYIELDNKDGILHRLYSNGRFIRYRGNEIWKGIYGNEFNIDITGVLFFYSKLQNLYDNIFSILLNPERSIIPPHLHIGYLDENNIKYEHLNIDTLNIAFDYDNINKLFVMSFPIDDNNSGDIFLTEYIDEDLILIDFYWKNIDTYIINPVQYKVVYMKLIQ